MIAINDKYQSTNDKGNSNNPMTKQTAIRFEHLDFDHYFVICALSFEFATIPYALPIE